MPAVPGPAQELEVDLAAFLPEGVELAEEEADDEGASASPVDVEALRQIEQDLDAVDAAIAALDAGTYGIDPATGEPIDDALLAEDPTRLS
jgi:RNA polymerase-binding transcription factor DksA